MLETWIVPLTGNEGGCPGLGLFLIPTLCLNQQSESAHALNDLPDGCPLADLEIAKRSTGKSSRAQHIAKTARGRQSGGWEGQSRDNGKEGGCAASLPGTRPAPT